MATAAVSIARPSEPVRSSRQSESAEISALRGSNRPRPVSQVQARCVLSAVTMIATAVQAWTSRSSHNTP